MSDTPACSECGTPMALSRKFNGGNVIDVWLHECDCMDRKLEAELDRRFGPVPPEKES